MTHPFCEVFVIIHLLWLLSGDKVIPLTINLDVPLQKFEDDSNF